MTRHHQDRITTGESSPGWSANRAQEKELHR